MIVGARCAGSSLAVHLARGGWRVAVVDKARFPSDTLSTHVVFPDGLARLDRLGVLDRLGRRHDLAPARYSWRVLGPRGRRARSRRSGDTTVRCRYAG